MADSTEHDLYTVLLREVTHMLGFTSLMNYSGTSVISATHPYFSRYDRHLFSPSDTIMLTHSGATLMDGYSFNTSLSNAGLSPDTPTCSGPATSNANHTTCSFAFVYDDSSSGGWVHQPVYTPGCFERGNSLSHFEDECQVPVSFSPAPPLSNNLYFAMSDGNELGNNKRYLRDEERQAICDLGYATISSFGDTLIHNYHAYSIGTCPAHPVAGVNDGFDSSYNLRYRVETGDTISVIDILANDHNATAFEGLQIIDGSGVLINVTGTTFKYVPVTTAANQLIYLAYTPVDTSTGQRGNRTFIVMGIIDTGECETICNLVPNGGFESGKNLGDIWSYPPADPVNADVDCWSSIVATPDYLSDCDASGETCPMFYTTSFDSELPTDLSVPGAMPPPLIGGNNFVGLTCDNEVHAGLGKRFEALETKLDATLSPGEPYTIKFWARVANNPMTTMSNSNGFLQFRVTNYTIPYTYATAPISLSSPIFTTSTQIGNDVEILVDDAFATWRLYELNFDAPATGTSDHLIVLNDVYNSANVFAVDPYIYGSTAFSPIAYMGSYIYMDSLQLFPSASISFHELC